MSAHEWLQADNPSSWPPPGQSTPPSPPPPGSASAPAPPAPATPAERPGPAPSPVPATLSGYDAPAPDSRWHSYLQQHELSPASSPTERPRVPLAGWLLLAGAALAAGGSFLTWASFPAEVERFGMPRSLNGFTEVAGESKDGPFFVAFAAILAGIGLTLLLTRRVLPVVGVGLLLAGFGAVAAVIDFLDVASPEADVQATLDPSVGPGLPVVIAGFVLALVGSVLGMVKRRGTPPHEHR